MSQPNSRAQSRAASVASNHGDESAPKPQGQQQQQQRQPSGSRQRGRSRTARSRSMASESESEVEAPPKRNRRRGGKKNEGQGLPAVDEIEDTGKQVTNTASNAVDTVGKTAGAVTGGGKEDDDSNPLKLRLDLNLDADIRLTAKIHGDVTLSLL